MKLKNFTEFISEKKKESFEDKIEDHGYFKGLSTSTARKKAAQMKKQAEMDDDNPDAYKPMPGSTKGKKLLKKSKFTKAYHELYGDEETNEALISADDQAYLDQITSFLKKYKDDRGITNDKIFTSEVIKVLKQRVDDRDGLVKKRFQKILKNIEKDFKRGNYLKLNESLTESSKRDPKSIRKQYKELKSLSIKDLRDMWSRSYQIGNPNELDKEGLISDILRGKHGGKYVDAAFESINEKFSYDKKDILDTANGIAKAISKMDRVKAEVHDFEFNKGKGAGFEISVDGEKSAGGSYIVQPNGNVVNIAIGNKFPNAVYARVGDIKHRDPIGKVDVNDIIGNIKLYESAINEKEKQSTDRSPIDDDAIETGLKNKSDETGVPIGILRAVMRRGMAAWKTGHRPGATQQQWGYARVSSFLTRSPGTWGRPVNDPQRAYSKNAYGADSDLAQEVIKGGHDKNLKTA